MNRIACSPLTGRIFSGRTTKDGNAFAGEKRDVTSDVLRAVIEKAAFHGGQFEIEGGDQKWTVTVDKGAAQPKREPLPAQPLSEADMADCGLLSELRLEEERRAEWHAEMRRDAFGDKA